MFFWDLDFVEEPIGAFMSHAIKHTQKGWDNQFIFQFLSQK